MSGNGFLKEYKFHNEYCTFRALSSVVFVCDTRKTVHRMHFNVLKTSVVICER